MEIKVLDNDNILINKNGEYYLIKEDYISGTFIKNYFIYQDYANNLDILLSDNEEELYFINEETSLLSAIKMIQENE